METAESKQTSTDILAAIKKFDTIIIHRHKRPDPDAIGSQAGLAEIIKTSFPKKRVLLAGGPVEGLDFLATMDAVTVADYAGALVIVTDTSNTARISGDEYNLGKMLIKMDHHPNDEPYGDLSYVNTKASSCSEIITEFLVSHPADLKMSDEGARLLYAGIVGDTGRFMYDATSARTFELTAILAGYNFDRAYLNRQIDQISLKVAKLFGYVLENLVIDDFGAGRVTLSQAVMTKYNVVDSETSAVVSLPGKVDKVVSWAIFVEQPGGGFRVRMRSKGPVINEIAKRHHGGGHPLASGANAVDTAECDAIYAEIQAAVRN